MAQEYSYPVSSSSSNPSIGTNDLAAPTSSTQVAGQDAGGVLRPLLTNTDGELIVNVDSLPAGLATSANQSTQITEAQTANTSLSIIAGDTTSIDNKTPSLGQASMANSVPVAIASDQSTLPISAASLPLPTGAATSANQSTINTSITNFANKTSSSDVSEDYDYREFTYVGATTDISTITYKTGGSGGTTVAVQTFAYDGSNRLQSITKT